MFLHAAGGGSSQVAFVVQLQQPLTKPAIASRVASGARDAVSGGAGDHRHLDRAVAFLLADLDCRMVPY